jgi:CRP/FNR family transcriptional regulator, anaerobic regulatory protein
LQTPLRFAQRGALLSPAGELKPAAILIRSGFVFPSCVLPDGRRAILDILVPGDIDGLDNLVLMRPVEEITAAGRVGYQALNVVALRELIADPQVALRMVAIIAEARWRADRLAAMIGRLDAQARICVMLLDIYDRLRQRGFINHPTYNLPLTQEQIGDYLGLSVVHVNRTLRRLREDKIVLVDRQVVIIMDVDRLRELAKGLPQPVGIDEPLLATQEGGPGRPAPTRRPAPSFTTNQAAGEKLRPA